MAPYFSTRIATMTMAILFFIVLAILNMLIPFFVLRIRNQVTQINEKMDTLIHLLSDNHGPKG